MKVHTRHLCFLKFEMDRPLRPEMILLGALLLAALLNGCATTSDYAETHPWDYNAISGYPAVGGAFSGP